MRTVLSRFSETFVRSVRPLLDPLEAASQGIADASQALPGREVLPELREIRHQLEVLVKKVDDQHAFVLIFGPLKSGKSTLMNALSAAYVSEVSSLPAYPCMVYVSHADTRSFEVTRYNGETETLEDPGSLNAYVARAHDELVESLYKAENSGEEFDPAVHFPQAIRRIDVRVPAKALIRSGAVLVDTPGLYSRMKFGYDRMTRDFRDAAASAIFVVKSDNLFLEQVFDEFNELLDLFSRIFLIVNVDSGKLDLGPDGELVPSLEQQDPERIVQAFKNYAMSAPLKRAAEEGRLRLYPIDLLRAASARLKGEEGGLDDAEPELIDDQDSFGHFLGDLTQFLNSTDYMTAFISDSIRRGESLIEETDDVLDRGPVREIGTRLESLWQERVDVERRREAVEKLSGFSWENAFDDFEQKLSNLIRDRVRVTADRTSDTLDDALNSWFESDASVQTLLEEHVKPALAEHHAALSSLVQETLSSEASGVAGGIQVSPEITAELQLAQIRADDMARRALQSIQQNAAEAPIEPLKFTDIPVRKRFVDWMLLRRKSSVQRRLFGPDSNPSLKIQKALKEARLGREGKQAMKKAIDRHKSAFFQASDAAVRESVLTQYASSMSKTLREKLEARKKQHADELAHLEGQVKEFGGVQDALDALRAATGDARRQIDEIAALQGANELVPQPPLGTDETDAETDAETTAEAETEAEAPQPDEDLIS